MCVCVFLGCVSLCLFHVFEHVRVCSYLFELLAILAGAHVCACWSVSMCVCEHMCFEYDDLCVCLFICICFGVCVYQCLFFYVCVLVITYVCRCVCVCV